MASSSSSSGTAGASKSISNVIFFGLSLEFLTHSAITTSSTSVKQEFKSKLFLTLSVSVSGFLSSISSSPMSICLFAGSSHATLISNPLFSVSVFIFPLSREQRSDAEVDTRDEESFLVTQEFPKTGNPRIFPLLPL
ncbi:hypothetical protein HanIR_Chr08g0347291 [Helianthus annuus]|nr:hypothetical protein HanIR_Chr08g0347291 [Helianthus annuus]